MTTTETVEALTKAVIGSEAGRRVGWARAYAAEATKDELARDVNMLRAERDIMRRAASFTYGFLQIYLERAGDAVAVAALGRWNQQMGQTLDSVVIGAGRDAARKVCEQSERMRQRREAKEHERRRRKNVHSREFKAAREQERHLLMRRYGFENEAALYNYLGQYRP